jgi:hypothetical protein
MAIGFLISKYIDEQQVSFRKMDYFGASISFLKFLFR